MIEFRKTCSGGLEVLDDIWEGVPRPAAEEIDRLRESLSRITSAFKPFTLKPIGFEGSSARAEQDEQIAAHAEALAICSGAPPIGLRVDQILNIITDYYDDEDTSRARRCAEHVASALASQEMTYGIFCKRTGEQIATVKHQENSGSCRCLSADRCEVRASVLSSQQHSTGE